jgi:hypothetical protein
MQAEQEAKQQQQGPPQGPPPPQSGPGRQGELSPRPPTGIPEEANAAEGGPIPSEFNPNATRELQTNVTRSGEPLAAP